MKPISEFSDRETYFFLIGINIVLKLGFLFIRTVPDDVDFYASTGWFLLNGLLPYQAMHTNIYSPYQLYWNREHPNGPLNYIFYYIIQFLFGDSTFAIKFPWLIAEIVISIYLFKLASIKMSKQNAFWASLFYIVCMPCYYTGILLGCDELITGAFALSGIYYLLNHRPTLGGMLLGFGIAYKLYPVFFFLPWFIYTWNQKLKKEFFISVGMGLLTYFLVSFPFLLLSPTEFIQYNFGQVNRFITISFGIIWWDTWLYQSLFTVPVIGISVTSLNLIQLFLVGGFFILDFGFSRHRIYSITSFFRAATYYLAMLPVISLSNNYRYFQWLLPLLILFIFPQIPWSKIGLVPIRIWPFKKRASNCFSNAFYGFIIISFGLNSIILIINLIQMNMSPLVSVLFGTRRYAEYIYTFNIAYIIALIWFLVYIPRDKTFIILNVIIFCQGVAGLYLYHAFVNVADIGYYYLPTFWLFLLFLILGVGIILFIIIKSFVKERNEKKVPFVNSNYFESATQ